MTKPSFIYERLFNGDIGIRGIVGKCPECLDLPTEIDGYRVYTVLDGAFDSSDITELFIPRGIYSLGNCCFSYCRELSAVYISNTIRFMGAGTFVDSSALSRVYFEEGSLLTEISRSSFAGTQIQEIVLPEKTENIGEYSFFMAKHLETITLPASLRQVEENAFLECSMLKRVIYCGNEEAFKKIKIHPGNEALLTAKVEYKDT